MNNQQIIENAPTTDWTHFSDEKDYYYKKVGDYLLVWFIHTNVWSIPVTFENNEFADLRRRSDIERIVELEKQNAVLAKFTSGCFEASFDGYSMDGGSIQVFGVELGLLNETVFDEAVHTDTRGYSENGDTCYEYADWFKPCVSKRGEHDAQTILSIANNTQDKEG